MKVIEVVYTWPAETFIQRHVLALREIGLDVRLIARQRTTFQQSWASIGEERRDIPALVMPNFDHLGLLSKCWSLRYLLLRPNRISGRLVLRNRVLLAFFEHMKPDLIHFHTATLAAMMRWIPQTLGIPYTVSLRGSDVQVMPLRDKWLAQEIGITLREAAGVHVVSQHLIGYAKRWAGEHIKPRLIYTLIPIPHALPPLSPQRADSLRFVTVGRLHWTKSYPDLLKAMRGLIDQGLKTHLTLVGNGPDEHRIRYWVKRLGLDDCVTFSGKVPWEQVVAFLRNSDAYISSSMAEGFGNTIAEAMAWGCPVFATDSCGIREVIVDGVSGFLLPALQPDVWVDKLALAQDRALMQRVRVAAYETARQLFDPRRHAESFIAFYEDALRRKLNSTASETAGAHCVKFPPNEVSLKEPFLLVLGEWRWENGSDLVLRALAPLCREGRLRVVFMGYGPQEDELRYLVDFLGLSGQVWIVAIEPEAKVLMQEWTAKAETVLDISEAQTQGWRLIQNNKLLATVSFADEEGLKNVLRSVEGEKFIT